MRVLKRAAVSKICLSYFLFLIVSGNMCNVDIIQEIQKSLLSEKFPFILVLLHDHQTKQMNYEKNYEKQLNLN